jgi:cytochrome o ubiquinol oxidase subunit 2
MRARSRFWVARSATLVAPILLAACQPGVLNPAGPIAAADRTILIDSVLIMLAIVLPTIALALGCAWWFRAGNTRARFMPNFVYSGQLELLVWGIPLLTIMLLGGVAWIGSHDSIKNPGPERAGRVARLEMAVHLSRPAHRQREYAGNSRRHAGAFFPHLRQRHECLLRAATW